jgi:uncharacterized protein
MRTSASMRNSAPLWTLVGVLLLLIPTRSVRAQEVPFLGGRVNDTAEMLSFGTVNELEMILKAHEDTTSDQVVVLTIPKLEDESLEEYSMKVVDTWKLGQAGKDNGVLLLIVRDDRKLRIEVGKGLEGVLTDAISGAIIRNEITPRFREGKYDEGVKAGVHAILATIGGTYTAPEQEPTSSMDIVAVIMGMLIFTIVTGTFTLVGISSKGFVSWFLYVFLMPFWLMFPFAFLGTVVPFVVYVIAFPVLKILLARNPAFQKKLLRWAPSTSGGGSGWSSRSSGGWSSSGGGFSGGGGGFSGGGSSGSW